MANTLTNLFQFIYDSVDVVSRELVGFVPSVYKNPKAEQVAKNQNITYEITNASTAYDIAPAAALPALDDDTPSTDTMAISKVRAVKFHWTGDDEAAIGMDTKQAIQNNKFAQAFRTLSNEMEADIAALYSKASRAYGTAGTAPFGTAGDFTDVSQVLKILKDNGASGPLKLVINTAAGANILGKQAQVHIVGSDDPLRRGVLLDINGAQIRESAAVKAHTKGTGASGTISNAGHAVGATTLNLTAVGTGTIVAGDICNFAGENNGLNYVINTGDADISNGGTLVLNKPGLVNIMSAATKAITVGNSYAANMAFAQNAIHLLTRLPKMPEGGDQADDVIVVQDPVSGMFFQIAMYRAYRSVLMEVAIAWGVKAAKTEHIALLIG